jgi:hypothetical protein
MALSTVRREGEVKLSLGMRKAAGLRAGRAVWLVSGLASWRSKLRHGGHLTLPLHLRKAEHLEEGDLIEIEPLRPGVVGVKHAEWQPTYGLPLAEKAEDQAWFWTEEWLEGEREATDQLVQGRVRSFATDEDFLDSLNGHKKTGPRGTRRRKRLFRRKVT